MTHTPVGNSNLTVAFTFPNLVLLVNEVGDAAGCANDARQDSSRAPPQGEHRESEDSGGSERRSGGHLSQVVLLPTASLPSSLRS